MSKDVLAKLITLALLAGALGFVVLRNQPSTATSLTSAAVATPVQDAVYAMFEAAQRGDVSAYLNAYAGSVRASLDQSVAEQGNEKFANYLREQTASVKGIAVQEPQAVTAAQAKIQIEFVYQDRNETQWMTLDKTGAGWKITRIEAAQRIKTLVPYGTPVN